MEHAFTVCSWTAHPIGTHTLKRVDRTRSQRQLGLVQSTMRIHRANLHKILKITQYLTQTL